MKTDKYNEDLNRLQDLRLRAKLQGLKAKPEFWALPIEELFELIGHGKCGPRDGIVEWLVPDHILGADIHPVCMIHDFGYATGVTKEDKIKADIRLYLNSVKTVKINFNSKYIRRAGYHIARVYYKAVRDHGDKAFWAGKLLTTE